MAVSRTVQISLAGGAFGSLAFILRPTSGTPIQRKDVVICKYPSDPTVALGSFSVVALFVSTVLGLVSVFSPCKGKSVPTDDLFKSTTLPVFFVIAVSVSALTETMMIWASITRLQCVQNVHHNLQTGCPTAKTALFGGGAFLALDAAQILAGLPNADADYLEEDPRGPLDKCMQLTMIEMELGLGRNY